MGSPLTASIVACANFNFLGARYSKDALPHAAASGLVYSPDVRKIQIAAQSGLGRALDGYIDLVAQRYKVVKEEAFYQENLLLHLTKFLTALTFTEDAYYVNRIVGNVIRRLSWISGFFDTTYAIATAVILFGALLGHALIHIPAAFIAKVSARGSVVYRIFSFVGVEVFWALPVIGVVTAMGGGLLEYQLLMAEIAGQDIHRMYNALFDVSEKIGQFSAPTKVFLAILIGNRFYAFAIGVVWLGFMLGVFLLFRADWRKDVGIGQNWFNNLILLVPIVGAWYLLIGHLPAVITLYLAIRAMSASIIGGIYGAISGYRNAKAKYPAEVARQ
jgi:hypothetical protein